MSSSVIVDGKTDSKMTLAQRLFPTSAAVVSLSSVTAGAAVGDLEIKKARRCILQALPTVNIGCVCSYLAPAYRFALSFTCRFFNHFFEAAVLGQQQLSW